MVQAGQSDNQGPAVPYVAAVVLPFYLNEFPLAWAPDAPTFLLIDYGIRVGVLAFVLALPGLRLGVLPLYRGARPPLFVGVLTVVCALAVSAIDTYVADAVRQGLAVAGQAEVAAWRYFRFPDLPPGGMKTLDLTVGLGLVAASEEVVFRGLFGRVLLARGARPVTVVVFSSVVFGAIHWGAGVDDVASATLAGAPLMMLYLRTGSLVPGMMVHYAVNLIAFWN